MRLIQQMLTDSGLDSVNGTMNGTMVAVNRTDGIPVLIELALLDRRDNKQKSVK